MKKTLMIVAIAMTGSFAHANLDSRCAQGLQEAARGYKQVQVYVKTGELTGAEKDFYEVGWKNAAKTWALTCVGLEQIKMERSLRGRLGLLSEDEAAQKSADIYTEAINYFNSLISE